MTDNSCSQNPGPHRDRALQPHQRSPVSRRLSKYQLSYNIRYNKHWVAAWLSGKNPSYEVSRGLNSELYPLLAA